MISAKEAAAIPRPSTAIAAILCRIEVKIRQAREDNGYTCWFMFNMREETHIAEVRGILESLGYEVGECNGKFGFSNTTLTIDFPPPTTEGE